MLHRRLLAAAAASVFVISTCSSIAFAQNGCEVPDAGGTVSLPPAGCEYLSPDEVHMILDGLPAGTTIELAPIHKNFICAQGAAPGDCELPGGSLGGNLDVFTSTLELQVQGTGDLAGFHRQLSVPIACEVHTAPRTPGEPVQSFDTVMYSLSGGLSGDPDFDQLQIQAGNAVGMPSPGHTTLTRLPSGDWAVDSFFDIEYRIDFVGAPGSVLEGMSGSTTSTIRMATPNSGDPVPTVAPWGWMLLLLTLAAIGTLWRIRSNRIARTA